MGSSLSVSVGFLGGPTVPSSPERHPCPHITSLGWCRVSLTLESRALDLVLWALAVEGSRRLHPSTGDCSNTNGEFIEVVKQSVDNVDGVFLINTRFRANLPSAGESVKHSSEFPGPGDSD